MQQIQRNGVLPVGEIHFMHREVPLRRSAGTVHDHVKAPETRHRALNRRLHLRGVADVRLNKQAPPALCHYRGFSLRARLRIQLNDRYVCALTCKRQCGRFGDTRAGAGDKRDLPI